MQSTFVFDIYQTLVDYPNWEQLKKTDPHLQSIIQKYKNDKIAMKKALLPEFDKAIVAGKIYGIQTENAKKVLEQLASIGQLAIFSTGTENVIRTMLEQSGLIYLFDNQKLLVPCERMGNTSKKEPLAYSLLEKYLAGIGFAMKTYTDDDGEMASAAADSGIKAVVYHFDRKSKLIEPKKEERIIRISNLKQILDSV